MTAFLTASCKIPADLHVAQSYDPNEALDASIGVYTVDGVDATALRDALIEAWKGDYPDMKVSQVTIGGKDVTKGDFGADSITSYLWVHDDAVYDIETSDEAHRDGRAGRIADGGCVRCAGRLGLVGPGSVVRAGLRIAGAGAPHRRRAKARLVAVRPAAGSLVLRGLGLMAGAWRSRRRAGRHVRPLLLGPAGASDRDRLGERLGGGRRAGCPSRPPRSA